MRPVAKGLLFGSIVGSAVGIIISQTSRGGMSPNAKRVVNKVGKMFRNII